MNVYVEIRDLLPDQKARVELVESASGKVIRTEPYLGDSSGALVIVNDGEHLTVQKMIAG